LQDDPHRPWSVKQRILSRHGHLSNDAAAELAEQVVSADLNRVYLGHLSSDCNTPDLARNTVARRMARLGATHVHIEAAAQDVPVPTFTLDHNCRAQQELRF
jgi:phosphoribosyl 1,2-cyclic phosphodiesterase